MDDDHEEDVGGVCWDCNGVRAIPEPAFDEGYGPCPSCVIEASATFVVWEPSDVPPEGSAPSVSPEH